MKLQFTNESVIKEKRIILGVCGGKAVSDTDIR